MTESEWLAATAPWPMQEFLGGRASDRKLRLFAVACCRRLWHLLHDERSRKAVEEAERFADGNATAQELIAAQDAAFAVFYAAALPVTHSPAHAAANAAAYCATYSATDAVIAAGGAASLAGGACTKVDQAILLRDVFGNPFRRAAFEPGWLTPHVVALARTAYAERAFDALPILADALEEAGCDNADILTHLRGAGPHVRGCWAVGLLLGKE